MSMAEYALDLSRQARLLDPPLSEPEIIRCVKRHYGVRISREIRPTTVSNLDDFIKLLDDLEADMNFEREFRVAEVSGKYSDVRGRTIAANVNNSRYDSRQTVRNSIPGDRLKAIEADSYKDKAKPRFEREQRVRITEITNDNDAKKFSGASSKKKVALIDRDNEDVDDREGDSFREKDEYAEVSANNDDKFDRDNDAESIPIVNTMRTKELIRTSMRCLIDTGAQISAITKRVYDKLVEAGVRMRVIPIRKFTLVGAFSDKSEVIANKIQVNFHIAERDFAYNLYVVRNLAYDMVLEMDFLSENNSILRCRRGRFEVEFDIGSKKTVRSIDAISVADANDRLDDILRKHEKIFRDEIGRVNNYEHRIRLTSRAPYKSKTYPIPEIHRERVKSHLLDLENTGIIERTSSQYINPLVVVPPTIDEIFRRIGTKKYFSTLDVSKAFWQIPLRKCDEEQQNAFNDIKAAFGEADNLFVIRSDYKFGIYVDASKRGLEARLYQYHESNLGEKFTVSYASRSLKGAELNYTMTELECLALIWALRKCSRIARWLAFLREFDLEIKHIPGKENTIADTLSRSSREIGKDRKDAAVKTIAAINYPDDNRETSNWVELVAEAQETDLDLQRDLGENPQHYVTRDNLIRVKESNEDRIVVPEASRSDTVCGVVG
ncbi:gag-pol fusion protein [Lasius niger]|uniref:Gag-pol fusion protein n=1 Tax=Lasius niger TaxID=67767 RepID=A0A0J7KCG2_LASNI|nr:gag-pol fusion protein [Lasius niger]